MGAASVEPGARVGDRWRIIEHIGEGGFGQVFRAVDESSMALGDAAVKVLHPNTSPLERSVFIKEVQRMAALRHHNLVGYLDSGQMQVGDEVHSYLVSEYCTASLDSFVAQRPSGVLNTTELLDVVYDISTGLAYLHSKQMIHRDIKPANVMFGDGAWKLGDFGLTRDLTATGSYHQGDSLRGTPVYMSPELFSTMISTAASDIYAVGVSAHLCATGRPLHQGSGRALLQNIMSAPASVDPSLDPVIQDIVRQCSASDPQARISAAERQQLVARYQSSAGMSSSPDPVSGLVSPHQVPPQVSPSQVSPPQVSPSQVSPSQVSPPHISPPQVSPSQVSPQQISPQQVSAQASPGIGQSSQLQPVGYATPTQQTYVDSKPSSKKSNTLAFVLVGVVLFLVMAVAGAVLVLNPLRSESETAESFPAVPEPSDIENSSIPPEETDSPDQVTPPQEPITGQGDIDIAGHLQGGCEDGPGSLGRVTNLHDRPISYRILFEEFDTDGVKVADRIENVRGLGPGQTSVVDFVSLEDSATVCRISEVVATESDTSEITRIQNVEIEQCVLDTFFGDRYDITYTVDNDLDVGGNATVYFGVVDEQGQRIDEDWAGEDVRDIPAVGTSREEASLWFSTIEQLETSSFTCEVIAVELEPS